MDAFLVTGPSRLSGSVSISGAKNAALPALTASLLTAEPVLLAGLPRVADIATMTRLLASMGVVHHGDHGDAPSTVTLRAHAISSTEAPYEVVRTMRAAILVLGPLVARFGEGRVSLPGGCAIGVRPVDLHLKALEAMGARIAVEQGYIHAHVSRVGALGGRLSGADIAFPQVTVTGTENVLMAACLARGTTRITNAAVEPEVTDLANLLVSMGASIEGIGSATLVIEGREKLSGTGDRAHRVLPDRIEAGTYLAAAAITGGDVLAKNARGEDLRAFLHALKAAGANVTESAEGVRVSVDGPLSPVDLATAPHPGFPTDLQAQLLALMTRASGTSRISETIFENRFLHVSELVRLGADIRIEGNTAVVTGPSRLQGAPVTASDLRASAALVLAALAAEGETLIRRIYHLDRGYDAMETKLKSLGANVERVNG